MTDTLSMGIAGRIARFFLSSQLTPLIAIVLVIAGVFAVVVTPREEEPQIDVTMANVFVAFPGASAKDVETLIAIPAEQVLSQIPGLEHVWSVSRPGQAMITVQYKVGVPRTEAIVRLHDTILSHRDWLPPELNVGDPLVKPKGIDDVPIVALTLWTRDPARGALRPRAGRARGRGGIEARARHARSDDDRRPRPGRAGAARPGEAERPWPRGRGSQAGAGRGEHVAACRHDRARQRNRLCRDRRVPADREGSARARRRRAGRAAGVSRRRRAGRGWPAAARALRVARARQGGGRRGGGIRPHVACGDDPGDEEDRRERGGRGAARRAAPGAAAQHGDPRRHRGQRHARLWPHRGRQGEAPHLEAAVRDAVRRRARARHARPARSGHRGRRGAADARGHAVRVVGVGLHAEPGQPVRADLLDRHPGRRRDRRRREHPSASRARARCAARHADPARRRRSGRPDHPRHVHGDRGAPADGVRHGADGSVHEPDPDQREHGHGDLARRRVRDHALAGAQIDAAARARGPRRRAGSTAGSRRRSRICSRRSSTPSAAAGGGTGWASGSSSRFSRRCRSPSCSSWC